LKLKLSFFEMLFLYPACIMGLLAVYAAGGTALSCQRIGPQVDCTLSSTRWLGMVATASTQLKQLYGANVEAYETCHDPDVEVRRLRCRSTRLVLLTADGEVRPDLLVSSVVEINTYIASGVKTLTVRKNGWMFSAVAGGFALLWYGFGSKAVGSKRKTPNRSHTRK
jgi:hypothetical protein